MIGTVRETVWRTVALEIDGIPQPEAVNQLTIHREAYFAYRAEAVEWLEEQEAEGFERTFSGDGIGSAAMSYFGPTDAPGNCWSVDVSKIAVEAT